jgi:subtilisin family serine protease
MRLVSLAVLTAAVAFALLGARPVVGVPAHTSEATTEVVVTLTAPPLAYAGANRETAATRIASEQRRFVEALTRRLPAAATRWRYRVVANGVAVVVPRHQVAALRTLPGVRDVSTGTAYRAALDRSPGQIGAPSLWGGAGLPTAGRGVKIGIIDDGVDQRHAFFDPAGYTMPPGFPKGQTAYTTAKVIVARAFPPPGATWRHAAKPFDSEHSSHGTHVAGIAAGNYRTLADDGRRLSGVAPRAFIGNYKALTVPTDSGVGLDGNAPELVAAIEAAVTDGMDVINLSLGEPEIEPTRDVVALALDAASAAGVVPVVAAGNDFQELGLGSVSSPGSSARAITVAAADVGSTGADLASFSSVGPTTLSLRLKPDVTAPGTEILSSVPGGWSTSSGTSMAAPHVSGGAAVLLQGHPGWTADQVKSALVATSRPLGAGAPVAPTRVGSGFVDLVAADNPLVLASPSSVTFGPLEPGALVTQPIALTDAGDGAGDWSVAIEVAGNTADTVVQAPASVAVPGTLELTALAGTADGEVGGSVTLTRNGVVRRVPFWLRVSNPALAAAQTTPLTRPGGYRGNTRGRASLVTTYRYPQVPPDGVVTARLAGPEQVFRLRIARPVANFGVVITSRARGVAVEPRVMVAGNESRLTGYAGLPFNLNPYLEAFGERTPVAGAIRPLAGSYDIVFDSRTAAGAGAFTFRLWVDDVTPPKAQLVTRAVQRGNAIRVRLADTGSGVDRSSLRVTVDGRVRRAMLSGGVVRIATAGLSRGRHALRLQASDYQETRNMENVARILPNTRVLRAFVTVR